MQPGVYKVHLPIMLAMASGSRKRENKKRYNSELPYQRPDLIEVIEIEIDLTTSRFNKCSY